jgi:hypothetical protein
MKQDAQLKLEKAPMELAPHGEVGCVPPGEFTFEDLVFRLLNPVPGGAGCGADQTSLWSYGVVNPPNAAVTVWVELTSAPGTPVGAVGPVVQAPFPAEVPAEATASGANWACQCTGLPADQPKAFFAQAANLPDMQTVSVPLNCTRVQM